LIAFFPLHYHRARVTRTDLPLTTASLALAVTVLLVLLHLPTRMQAQAAAGVEIMRLPSETFEASGIGQSRANPDIFWTHNDSGDSARAYAVNRMGSLVGTFTFDGVRAVDWEDMALGPAPGGGSYLYMADIGDNNARRASVQVYRAREPRVSASQAAVTDTLHDVDTFEFAYDNGPRDAECLMVDPLSGDFYVVSKREPDGNFLYRAENPQPRTMNQFVRVGRFSFTWTTSCDIAPDGLQVLVRRYSDPGIATTAATYWRRSDTSLSLVDLLKQPGTTLPLVVEKQGEAIAFATDGAGFFTTTEVSRGDRSPVTYYTLPPRR
jgi:hypothetical protein